MFLIFSVGLMGYFFSAVYSNLTNAVDHEKWLDTIKTLPLWLLLSTPFFYKYSNDFSLNNFFYAVVFSSVGLFFALGYSIYQVFFLDLHASGFFGNPIYYAYSLIPSLFFFTELVLKRHFYPKNWVGLFYTALALTSIALFLSANRMALILLLLALIFIFSKQHKETWRLYTLIMLGLFVVGIAVYVSMPAFQEKLNRTFSGGDISIRARIAAWSYNLELISKKLFWGYGYKSNAINTARLPQFIEFWSPGHDIFAHNIYLQVLAEFGIFGFFSLLLVFLAYLKAFGPCLPLLATLIAGLTENTFNNSKAFHPFLLYTILSGIFQLQYSRKFPENISEP